MSATLFRYGDQVMAVSVRNHQRPVLLGRMRVLLHQLTFLSLGYLQVTVDIL